MPDPSLFTSVANSYFPEPQASLLNGILFGIPISKTNIIYKQLQQLGLLHIVVLSGLNITILAGFISMFTAKFSKHLSILIVILSIIFFIVFVRPQAPIVRAGFMGVLTFVAIYAGRRTLGLYSLLLSAIFIAVVWPEWLTNVSFYLSYAATLGILLFSGNMSEGNKIVSFVTADLRTSIAAQIFTTPIIFIYFKQLSLIAPLSNLLISFVIPPLMMFGFLTVILGKIHFLAGLPFAYISYGLLSYVTFITENLSQLPFIFFSFNE